jgi:hypothetical protein
MAKATNPTNPAIEVPNDGRPAPAVVTTGGRVVVALGARVAVLVSVAGY